MEVELKIAKNEDSEEWDKLVENSPHGTIFHTWKWLKIAEKHTNSKLYPIIGYKGTKPVGIYPFFLIRKKGVKLLFSPPPKTLLLYLGPTFSDFQKLKQSMKESLFMEFQTEVDNFITSKLKGNYIRIRTSPGLLDSRPLRWAGYHVEPLYTYVMDLTKGTDNIWNGFNKELRRNINKAQKEDIKVEEGSKEEIYIINELLRQRFEEQGYRSSKDYYRSYLSDVYEAFYPQNLRIFVAKYSGEIITGQIAICYSDKISLWAGSPKTNILRGTPNDLLQWEIIKWACKHGFRQYEIMDAGDDPRLRHFKAKFNPELVPWYSAVKYSSPIFKGLERTARFVYSKLGPGRLI